MRNTLARRRHRGHERDEESTDNPNDPEHDEHTDDPHSPPKAGQTKTNAKQRDIDLLFEAQEKERRGMEMHNQRLRQLIELRQNSTKRAEGKAEAEITRLKLRLSDSTTKDVSSATSMQAMRAVNQQIQTKISHLHKTIELQAEHDKMNLVRQYRVKMHELRKELNDELQTNYRGSQEWIDRNNILTAEYDRATEALESVSQGNIRLAHENKELKILFKKQEEERQSIIKQVTAARRENRRLKEQVTVLEAEGIALTQKGHQQDTFISSPRTDSMETKDMGQESRYLELINRAKRQVEQERRTLKQVRANHIDLLQERTEAEVFLRQCLQDVRRDISAASASHSVTLQERVPATALEEYTAEHRASLLELLFSKERILALLYGKAFPFKAQEDTDRALLRAGTKVEAESALQKTTEMDIDQLWSQWQSWTEKGGGGGGG